MEFQAGESVDEIVFSITVVAVVIEDLLRIQSCRKRQIGSAKKWPVLFIEDLLIFAFVLLLLLAVGGGASPIWASAAVTHLKKLHVFKNKHLRKLTNAPWFVRKEILHKDLKIDPILDFIKNQSKKFFDRSPQIPNQSIRVIPAYDNSVPSSAKRPRAVFHHTYQHFPVLKRLRRS
ncbi:uncharacterized protein TNCV_5082731 [Trichonephila clavipes]|nr:uncharacterized protein TNCV_5082731 [Trichonephila clavipes]